MAQNQKPAGNRNKDFEVLFNEIIFRRYLTGHSKARELFGKISVPEYIILHSLAAKKREEGDANARVYLRQIAQQMEIKTATASKMIRKLRDRGLVIWTHEGSGEKGTFIELTEAGEELVCNQEQILKDYFGRVLDKFGQDNTLALLALMQQLEQIMKEEYTDKEAAYE